MTDDTDAKCPCCEGRIEYSDDHDDSFEMGCPNCRWSEHIPCSDRIAIAVMARKGEQPDQREVLKPQQVAFRSAGPGLLVACRKALSWFRRARRGSLAQMEEALGEDAPIELLAEAIERIEREPEELVHVCAECGQTFPIEEPLHPITRFWERVEAGDVVPSGQCHHCGGLCYLHEAGANNDPVMRIYHRDELPDPLADDEEIASGWPERYRLVATVRTDQLDEAFRKTNTVEQDWWTNPGVTPVVWVPLRSTSVGDVIVGGDGSYLCCAVGWKKIDQNHPESDAENEAR
jgi:hypothetical protein